MKRIIAYSVAVFMSLSLVACSLAPDDVNRILESQGLTEIYLGGPNPFNCGKDDNFSTTFTAKSANGQPVSGIVCGALFKGMTVRYF